MAISAIEPHSNQTTASTWRWFRGMVYIVAVALIWIAASFVVQSVVDSGVSPFLITYICNSLFVIYIPIIEVRRYFDRVFQQYGWGRHVYEGPLQESEGTFEFQRPDSVPERENFLESELPRSETCAPPVSFPDEISDGHEVQGKIGVSILNFDEDSLVNGNKDEEVEKAFHDRPWSRKRTALIGLTICPFWFIAQFTFNLSLKYTTVTSNTILSTTSSIFTFLVSLQFLGEKFTWLKLASVSLCMAGTILVSLGDSWKGGDEIATNPLLGDVICLSSAMFYATYTALIRVNIPDEEDKKGTVSTALVFGYLGLFNALLLAPVAFILHFTGIEPFYRLTLRQVVLIVGKGLFDNVLSDYLWARAVLLTTPTAATAGLTIQVPIAALIDSLRGLIPSYMEVAGAVAVLIGFFGINQPDPQLFPIKELGEKVDGDLSLDGPVTVSSSS